MVALAGLILSACSSDDDEADADDEPTVELVLGPDGEPLQYVLYDENEHRDRNGDGVSDHLTDVNDNGIPDSWELWDQENQEFVPPPMTPRNDILTEADLREINNLCDGAGNTEFEAGTSNHWDAAPYVYEGYAEKIQGAIEYLQQGQLDQIGACEQMQRYFGGQFMSAQEEAIATFEQ